MPRCATRFERAGAIEIRNVRRLAGFAAEP
jgi:hypothetical protein